MDKNVLGGHPKGLYLLFSVEMWERFSYYGMRALLVLYLIQYLFAGMDEKVATQYAGNIYGWYTGLVYLTPLVGGYIADKFLGQRKCISIGAIVMAIGLFTLAASGFECFKSISVIIFTIGLTLMIIANGFFKSNISTIVGMLYGDDKQKRDAGFTIFYMGINLGAFFSPLICGTLAQLYGFKYGFMAAGLGIIFGYITYKLGENKLLGEHGLKPVQTEIVRETSEEEDIVIRKKLTTREKRRIYALFILMTFSIFFWICFEQAGCSFTLFAENETQRHICGFEIPTGYFQSLNPLFIITIAPLMSMFWSWLASKGKEPTSVVKFCIALGIIGFSALIMATAAHFAGESSLVSPLWLVFTYLCATLAELCLSPIGLSLVTKLAPAQFASILMGTWFLSSFFGNLIAGVFSGFYEHMSHTLFFCILAGAAFVIAIILTAIRPVLQLWMGKN